MDFLKAQAAKIREQLAGLSPSQRMLAGTLVVIMVMTLLWWSRYAGSSEMEELLPQDFSAEDIARITAMIDSRGIPRKLNGNRIQVAADRRLEVLGMLTYEQIGPRDTSSGWDEVVQKMNSPWNPDKVQDIMFNRAKEASLAQVMREWPGVRDARVIINNAQRRAFGEANVAPSATVNIKMRNPGEKAPRRLIAAAADTVSGAVAGMQRSNVKVIVDGASYTLEDPGQGGAAGGESWVERVKEHELYYYRKIQERLSKIDGVMVSVSVDVKAQASQIEKEEYDKGKTFSQPLKIDEKNDESTTTSRPPSEPGAVPNTGGANQGATLAGGAAGAGGEGTTTNSTDSKIQNQIFPTRTIEKSINPAGTSNVVGASVSVPRSYFVKIFKMANPTAKDPDDTALTPLVDSESRKIKNAVMGCVTQNTPEDKILVDMYWDFVPASETAGGQPAVATSIPLALSGHVKEIVLGALALLSLFMVSMMVRKTTPPAIVVPKAEKVQAAAIDPQDIATEVSEGIQSMDAVEVNDDSVRTQQIIGQVSNMVKEDPDAAANLVKRWLNRA
jgi:flagellar biosynthesis/type III secretory pathway M-ring protein FliF/YscJ